MWAMQIGSQSASGVAIFCSGRYNRGMSSTTPAPVWVRWLEIAAAAVIVFSAGLILFPGLTQPGFNIIAFGHPRYPPGFTPAATAYIAFVYTVLGAVMIGWMLAILALIRIPFARGEAWAWWAIAISMAGWLTIDSLMSFALGFPGNVILNTSFALAFAIPLAATFRMRN